MNWNRTHTNKMEVLRKYWVQYEQDAGHAKPRRRAIVKNRNGYGFRYGNAGYVRSERQYVLDRMRSHFAELENTSDQSIWAKYRRVNGLAGKAAMARYNVAKFFKATNGMVFTDGMDMADWKDLGLNFLGQGATRVVYELDENTVLKVAKDDGWFDGRKSNGRERKVWEKAANTKDSDAFAAVLAGDSAGTWIIQQRVPKAGHDSNLSADERRNLVRVAGRYNVSDLHGGNFGRTASGKAVLIDYASA